MSSEISGKEIERIVLVTGSLVSSTKKIQLFLDCDDKGQWVLEKEAATQLELARHNCALVMSIYWKR